MFVKQIDMDKALELAAKGMEIKVLVPSGPGSGWESMEPGTLRNMLEDVMFFRTEPAPEKEILPDQQMEGTETAGEKLPGDPAEGSARARPEKNRLNVDVGKMRALQEAGWSFAKIADEMRISKGSVYNYLRRAEEEKKRWEPELNRENSQTGAGTL